MTKCDKGDICDKYDKHDKYDKQDKSGKFEEYDETGLTKRYMYDEKWKGWKLWHI